MTACVKLAGNLGGAISSTKSWKVAFHTRKPRKERNTILRSTMPQPPPKGTTCRWGGKSTFQGLCHSEETRKKMADAQRGKVVSEETKKRLSEANKGKHCGILSPMYGKPKSPETIQKQYDSHRFQMKAVVQMTKDGTFVAEYCSINSAARSVGTSKQAIGC